MLDPEKHSDPKPSERSYVRHAQNGELGYLVEREGRQTVKLDNAGQEILRPYVPGDWVPETVRRQLMPMAVARVAFEADKALCRELGLHQLAIRSWDKLKDGQRQDFAARGPGKAGSGPRNRLWMAVKVILEESTKP